MDRKRQDCIMKLAIHGGAHVRTKPFPAHVTVGKGERETVCRVINSGVLSRYFGVWHEQFMGGAGSAGSGTGMGRIFWRKTCRCGKFRQAIWHNTL